ncbi:DALR anticodon-binding domain-containing protein [Chroococcidiopsis sp. CCMEE 29]|uniref:DALR anticodon-binding domain-containing protein n=1 Tax=Chroococcidiopsis sp. CCMEE 29 TaxID=155894 RepID=UPI0020211BF5|nr:DALR anticodon-binding domain-containing protein [Chroococcidiopsis sp. CCMEE 29]
MNYPLPSVTYPAIKQFLLSHLKVAVDLYIPNPWVLIQLKNYIPLYRAKDFRRVLYVTAIAFRLSKVKKIPALEIASALAQLIEDIATRCCQVESRLGAADERDFTVQVVPPGWIHFELTNPKLASWLQHLTQMPPELVICRGEEQGKQEEKFPASSGSPLFAVQYAHARCCSLLQMAHREGLITLRQTNWDTSSAFWLAVSPNPIPWLNSGQQLCLDHPAERALIVQLLALLDELYCPRPSHQPINWHKAALDLSQTFQTFYSGCQIWGEVKNQNLSLSQARLGLVLITQSVLRLLLKDRLGVVALQEL